MFDANEKKVLKLLVKKEFEGFEKEEDKIIEKSIPDVKLELKYGEFLKNLMKKLEWTAIKKHLTNWEKIKRKR